MVNRSRLRLILGAFALALSAATSSATADDEIRVGIIGLDTSHAIAFPKVMNDPKQTGALAKCRVVAAYPKGSPDIQSSVSRVPKYTQQIRDMGIEIVDSIPDLLERVDAVLLETNDGRPHLEQVIPVFKAGKPVFIDKPVAGTLADAIAIAKAAKRYKTPFFSSSSLRYATGVQAVANGSAGKVLGADVYSPCSLEPTHPDLFWYGIHGVEMLYTVMGTGCVSVTRTSTADTDTVVGQWSDGRIGMFRGMRSGKRGYGGTAYGTKLIANLGTFTGYNALVVEIAKFFDSGNPPVSPDVTIEIYAFMEAADESKRQNGKPVTLAQTVATASRTATQRLTTLNID